MKLDLLSESKQISILSPHEILDSEPAPNILLQIVVILTINNNFLSCKEMMLNFEDFMPLFLTFKKFIGNLVHRFNTFFGLCLPLQLRWPIDESKSSLTDQFHLPNSWDMKAQDLVYSKISWMTRQGQSYSKCV